ncbi:15808_t:CDS:2 [Acaulospora colombiana]|uniref:15808_t:CDS:1 n=1 Tax=Acaulospora colombiana TaxID=27376 RepID=A0ACA9KHS0_9GLOM|nr:15808_t:CDS:2 [Acaulospora colombiana]
MSKIKIKALKAVGSTQSCLTQLLAHINDPLQIKNAAANFRNVKACEKSTAALSPQCVILVI